MRLKKNFNLKRIISTKLGGPAAFFLIAKNQQDVMRGVKYAESRKLPWRIIGDGSNIIPADKGFNGMIIQNKIKKIAVEGNKITVGAGNNLIAFIRKINSLGFAGMEKMFGIPGSVGGAVYGCAGAYGQEIKDYLIKVRVLKDKEYIWLSNKQCRFGYRESIFKKHPDWIIVHATFKFKKGNPRFLTQESKKIRALREKKYRPGLLCPGSFFKNICLADLTASSRKKLFKLIDAQKVNHGKLPAGFLLEEIGAKGMRQRGIRVAKHHANLIYNSGRGTSSDAKKLANLLKQKVKRKFGIMLEEEVQYL